MLRLILRLSEPRPPVAAYGRGGGPRNQVSAIQKEQSVTENLKRGDKVEWQTSQGKTRGTVKRKLTKPTEIKGHHVAASTGEPQLLVESEETGAEAAHKPGALKKARE